jgi:hypothetical protein
MAAPGLSRQGVGAHLTGQMCKLYSMTKAREADRTGNQPPLPAIFPDQLAPVAR